MTAIILAAVQVEGLPQVLRAFLALYAFWVCLALGFWLFWVYCFCRIAARVGRHWAYGLLALLPAGEVLLVLILAFGACPKEGKRSRSKGK
ncbi:MAG: hypothetical protein GXY74_02470 [Phycisphaerae bacterium]|nr:hypothetical protein [Phycisphaerae bacterium]